MCVCVCVCIYMYIYITSLASLLRVADKEMDEHP